MNIYLFLILTNIMNLTILPNDVIHKIILYLQCPLAKIMKSEIRMYQKYKCHYLRDFMTFSYYYFEKLHYSYYIYEK